jgi:rubrerythrin
VEDTMGDTDAGILDAIQAAMTAEKKAQTFYLESAGKAASSRGQELLRQLAAFEENHYGKLSELKASLSEGGAYIAYEGTDFAFMTSELPGEMDEGRETNLDDVLSILSAAIDAETDAYERYQKMATQVDNPRGKEMFIKFAREEMLHRRILSDEFYHLSNKEGVWTWGE